MRSVHQFHPGAFPGDAITNQLFYLQGQLRHMGYRSEIYGATISPGLTGLVHPISQFDGGKGDLLLLHHSLGYRAMDDVISLPCDIVTSYHNITPVELEDDPVMRPLLSLGRAQLPLLAARSTLGIAASNYNRRELIAAGFDRVEVLPVRLDFTLPEPSPFVDPRSGDWLFVGRMVPSKGQRELVTAFAHYRHTFDHDARLILIGDVSRDPYVEEVRAEAARCGLASHVVIRGKVSQEELEEAYATAGVYVSLSRHEGFGVPILEAMAAGVPVVALAEAAIPETMGRAGVLLRTTEPAAVAATVRAVLENPAMTDRLVAHQFDRLARLMSFQPRRLLRRVINQVAGAAVPRTLQVQGPFETSYSLAVLNRHLAVELAASTPWDVSLYATEGPGDYVPDPRDLDRHPDALPLYEARTEAPHPDYVIRQMYPPRVEDSPGALTFQYFGWEESRIPNEIVSDFNTYLDGIATMSSFVADSLRHSGVSVPITTIGVGVIPPDPMATIDAPELDDLAGVRFLHISSAFPRKGVDLLLAAYFAAFSADDDVDLILKTFPNPHNEVARQLEALRAAHPNPPSVRWIDRDLDEAELHGLYNLATVYVHAARGEGFGLPVAEAMAAGIPVIAPASTGMADFVSDLTATTVPFIEEQAATHLSVPGSHWTVPDGEALAEAMRLLAQDPHAPAIRAKMDAAQALMEHSYSWAAVAERMHAFIAQVDADRHRAHVALVTTWNSRCGIAEHARYLVTKGSTRTQYEIFADRESVAVAPQDETGVTRVWAQGLPDLSGLEAELLASPAEIVHIQHNFGFFHFDVFNRFLVDQARRRPVVLTLHRTEDYRNGDDFKSLTQLREGLAAVDAVVVHRPDDAARVAALGVTDRIHVLPLGNLEAPAVTPDDVRQTLGLGTRPILGTFGFLLPHKGTLDLVRAVGRLRAEFPDLLLLALCASYPNPISDEYRDLVEAEIAAQGLHEHVMLFTEFLEDEEVRTLLRACDVIVLPYDETAESESAAMRMVLPIGRAVAVTDRAIFANAGDAVARIDPEDPHGIDATVRHLLTDPDARADLARRAAALAERSEWDRITAAHRELYRAVRAARQDALRSSGTDDPTAAQ